MRLNTVGKACTTARQRADPIPLQVSSGCGLDRYAAQDRGQSAKCRHCQVDGQIGDGAAGGLRICLTAATAHVDVVAGAVAVAGRHIPLSCAKEKYADTVGEVGAAAAASSAAATLDTCRYGLR